MYRQNRSHILKTEVDEDHVIEISDDINKKDNSQEYVTVHSDDTLKDMKQDKSEVNYTNKWEDANDTIEPEKITRSGRVSRRPKEYENYEPCLKKGNVILMYICVGHLLDSDTFSIRLCYNWWPMCMTNGKTCKHVYYYMENIINYGNSAANKYYSSADHHEQKNKKTLVKLIFGGHDKTINKTSLIIFSL